MKNLLTYLILLIVAAGCGEANHDNEEISIEDTSMNLEKSCENCEYFDFDEIIYYHFNIDEVEVSRLRKYETSEDSILKTIIIDSKPKSLDDTSFFNNLELMADNKVVLDSIHFKEIRELFRVENHEESVYESCIATWKDVLVFKKENKVIGTAKFTFRCYRNFILGAKYNTDEFGYEDDYKRLRELLYNELK